MTDRLERDLTTLFHDRATATDAPPVPLDRLLRDGEAAKTARRRRTRVVAVAAVAAAVALAATIPLLLRGQDGTTPQPAGVPTVTNTGTERPASAEDLPAGPPPSALPYTVDDTLHFRGREFDMPVDAKNLEDLGDGLHVVGDEVLLVDGAWSELQGNRPTSLFITRNGEFAPLREVPTRNDFSNSLAVSPDGSMLAAASRGDGAHRLTAYALPSGEEVGRVDVSEPSVDLGGMDVVGVDADGRVYWGRGPFFVWTPGQEPQRLDLPRDSEILAITPGGLVLQDGDELRHGTVSAAGEFTTDSSLDLPQGEDRIFVMDDVHLHWIGGNRPSTGPPDTVADVRTGKATDLLLPVDTAGIVVLTTEGGRNLILLAGREGTRHVLRCSVTSGACDRILTDLPDGARVLLRAAPPLDIS